MPLEDAPEGPVHDVGRIDGRRGEQVFDFDEAAQRAIVAKARNG